MPLESLIHDLWIGGIALQVLLAGILLAKRAWQNYPAFAAYIFFNLFGAAASSRFTAKDCVFLRILGLRSDWHYSGPGSGAGNIYEDFFSASGIAQAGYLNISRRGDGASSVGLRSDLRAICAMREVLLNGVLLADGGSAHY